MTRHLPLAVVAVLFALAAPAQAKEITKVVVCGADGCRKVTSKAHDSALMEMGVVTGGPREARLEGPGFVRVQVTIGGGAGGEHFTVTQLYVPARDLLATRKDGGGWVWTIPRPDASRQLRRAARGARPIPARRLPAAALLTDPAPTARVAEVVQPPKVETTGADGGIPGWGWPLAGLVVLLSAATARRHSRA